MSTDHIVRSYDQELEELRRSIAQMGGLAESQLDAAIQCVVKRDAHLAGQVVQNDERLDALEYKIDADVGLLPGEEGPLLGLSLSAHWGGSSRGR